MQIKLFYSSSMSLLALVFAKIGVGWVKWWNKMFSVNSKFAAEYISVGKQIDLLTKIRKKFLCLKLLIINFQNSFLTLTCIF